MDCTYYKVCDETTYPFSNVNGVAIGVWENIVYFISHFTGHVITGVEYHRYQ